MKTLMTACLGTLLLASAAKAANFHVAMNGKDTNPGTVARALWFGQVDGQNTTLGAQFKGVNLRFIDWAARRGLRFRPCLPGRPDIAARAWIFSRMKPTCAKLRGRRRIELLPAGQHRPGL